MIGLGMILCLMWTQLTPARPPPFIHTLLPHGPQCIAHQVSSHSDPCWRMSLQFVHRRVDVWSGLCPCCVCLRFRPAVILRRDWTVSRLFVFRGPVYVSHSPGFGLDCGGWSLGQLKTAVDHVLTLQWNQNQWRFLPQLLEFKKKNSTFYY